MSAPRWRLMQFRRPPFGRVNLAGHLLQMRAFRSRTHLRFIRRLIAYAVYSDRISFLLFFLLSLCSFYSSFPSSFFFSSYWSSSSCSFFSLIVCLILSLIFCSFSSSPPPLHTLPSPRPSLLLPSLPTPPLSVYPTHLSLSYLCPLESSAPKQTTHFIN